MLHQIRSKHSAAHVRLHSYGQSHGQVKAAIMHTQMLAMSLYALARNLVYGAASIRLPSSLSAAILAL